MFIFLFSLSTESQSAEGTCVCQCCAFLAVHQTGFHFLQFATENEMLFAKINSTANEWKHIEGKVIEISRLQKEFSDKVLIQVSVF
jgi:hypothetical protein